MIKTPLILTISLALLLLMLKASSGPAQSDALEQLALLSRAKLRYHNEYQAMQPELIDPIFLEYVQTLAQDGDTGLFDGLREFIFRHSLDAEDQGRNADGVPNVKNIAWITQQWARCLDKADCALPELKCDHRAMAMETLLLALGRQARLVHVFGIPDRGAAEDHSMLEVFNPDSRRWELQDPFYNAIYVDRKTRRRASALDIVLGGHERFEPCSGEKCGPEILDPAYLERVFQAVIYDRTRALKPALAVVLTSRMSPALDWNRRDQHEYLRYLKRNFVEIEYLFQ